MARSVTIQDFGPDTNSIVAEAYSQFAGAIRNFDFLYDPNANTRAEGAFEGLLKRSLPDKQKDPRKERITPKPKSKKARGAR